MTTAREAFEAAAGQFTKNAREHANVELDGSLKSLILVSAAMQKYHAMYKRAAAARDPDLEKFVEQVGREATAYVSSVFINNCNTKLSVTKEGKLILIASGEQPHHWCASPMYSPKS